MCGALAGMWAVALLAFRLLARTALTPVYNLVTLVAWGDTGTRRLEGSSTTNFHRLQAGSVSGDNPLSSDNQVQYCLHLPLH
jgi:hypothetical protein